MSPGVLASVLASVLDAPAALELLRRTE